MPILQYCKIAETRKMLHEKYFNIEIEKNAPLINEIIELRNTYAKLLGYDNYAAFMLDDRMAGNQINVINFNNNLIEKLEPLIGNDYKAL